MFVIVNIILLNVRTYKHYFVSKLFNTCLYNEKSPQVIHKTLRTLSRIKYSPNAILSCPDAIVQIFIIFGKKTPPSKRSVGGR